MSKVEEMADGLANKRGNYINSCTINSDGIIMNIENRDHDCVVGLNEQGYFSGGTTNGTFTKTFDLEHKYLLMEMFVENQCDGDMQTNKYSNFCSELMKFEKKFKIKSK